MAEPFKITIEQNSDGRFEWVVVSIYKRAIASSWADTREQAWRDADNAWNRAVAEEQAASNPPAINSQAQGINKSTPANLNAFRL